MTLLVTIKQGIIRRHNSTIGSPSLRLRSGRSSKKVGTIISKISQTITSKRTGKMVLTKSAMNNFCKLKRIRKLLKSLNFREKKTPGKLANSRREAKTNLMETRLQLKLAKKKQKNEPKRKKLKCNMKPP